jgi:hypothetical protein
MNEVAKESLSEATTANPTAERARSGLAARLASAGRSFLWRLIHPIKNHRKEEKALVNKRVLKLTKRFDRLTSIGEEDKTELRGSFEKVWRLLTERNLWAEVPARFFTIPMVIVAIVLFLQAHNLSRLFSPKLADLLSQDISPRRWLALAAASALLYLPGVIASLIFSKSEKEFLAVGKVLSCWFVLVLLGYFVFIAQAFYFDHALTGVYADFVAAAAYMLFFLGCILSALYPIVLVVNALRKRIRRLYPQDAVTRDFFDILVMLEEGIDKLGEAEFKQQLISKLEEASRCIEVDLPRRLRAGEAASDAWIKTRAEEMAAGVRSLIKGVVTPNQYTYEWLQRHVADYFVHSLRGDWDSFERVTPEKVSPPQLLRTRALRFLRALGSAAVPLVILLIVYKWNLVPDPTVFGYLEVGALAWAALGFVAQLDPDYAAKITAVKDVAGLFKPSGKESNEKSGG